MKRVLFISYYWPPAGGPGAQRAAAFARYLPQFGWDPIVLTVRHSEVFYKDPSLTGTLPKSLEVHRTASCEPYRLYKTLTGRTVSTPLPVGWVGQERPGLRERWAGWLRLNLFIPDARAGWIPFAIHAGARLIRRGDIDLIFSSSPPHSLQIVGRQLKRRFGLPWVADLRDPWSGNRHSARVRTRTPWAQALDRRWERRCLRAADHVTTVSPSLAQDFQARLLPGRPFAVTVLTNGYDPADFKESHTVDATAFRIVHTGNLLAQQNPLVLWKSLHALLAAYPDMQAQLRIRFTGHTAQAVLEAIQRCGLTPYLETRDFIPHREIVAEMQQAAILLVVIPETPNNAGIITAKLCEYAGSGRPILLIGPREGDAAGIMQPFDNSFACDEDDVAGCSAFITQVYRAWQAGALPETPAHLRAPFSRQAITAQLAACFDQLV